MPVTPFHFGPGLLLHAMAPRRVSFMAFCASNVAIDVESLVNLVRGHDPVHAFFHSFVGATLAGVATAGLVLASRQAGRGLRLPNLFGWLDLSPVAIAVGALLGAWSHVLLDGMMHADLRPFLPFGDANPLLHTLSLGALHLGCLAAGAAGALLLAWRQWRRRGALP
jgi:membrane-bound metal-dependent hydrolase YbcI (DUF457 family)